MWACGGQTLFCNIFDFGEEYRINCKVLKELEEDTENAVVIKGVGEPMPLFGDPDSEEPEAEDVIQMTLFRRYTMIKSL
jgi:hypothetical protein